MGGSGRDRAKHMRHKLAVIHSEPIKRGVPPRRHHTYNLLMDLSDEEYDRASEAIATLQANGFQRNLFALASLNYQEYFQTLKTHLGAFIQNPGSPLANVEVILLEANRRLLNFLASFWVCVQFTENYLKREHGRTSENVKRFTQYLDDVHNSNFPYRFLRMLWDYAHHSNLPIGNVSLSAKPKEHQPKETVHTLEVGVRRHSLLDRWDYKKDQALKEEISRLSDIIDINPYLSAIMEILESIKSKFEEIEYPSVEASAIHLDGLLQKISYTDGQPCIVEYEEQNFGVFETNDVTHMNVTLIPIEMIRKLLHKERKIIDLGKAEQVRIAFVRAGIWDGRDVRSPLVDKDATMELQDRLRAAGFDIQINISREGEKQILTISVGTSSATGEYINTTLCEAALRALGVTIE